MPKRAYIPYQPLKRDRPLRPVAWIASSHSDLKGFSEEVRRRIGHALHEVQAGRFPPEATPLHGALSGVSELRADDAGGTYRAMYTVRFKGVVYVLHVFQKKSPRGSAMSRRDIRLILGRLATAKRQHESTSRTSEDRP